jgi:hypothetical protein
MRVPNLSFGQSGLKILLIRSLIVKACYRHYAREKIAIWREEYNSNCPHETLDNLTPREFVETTV